VCFRSSVGNAHTRVASLFVNTTLVSLSGVCVGSLRKSKNQNNSREKENTTTKMTRVNLSSILLALLLLLASAAAATTQETADKAMEKKILDLLGEDKAEEYETIKRLAKKEGAEEKKLEAEEPKNEPLTEVGGGAVYTFWNPVKLDP
jgi:hypothetical protein